MPDQPDVLQYSIVNDPSSFSPQGDPKILSEIIIPIQDTLNALFNLQLDLLRFSQPHSPWLIIRPADCPTCGQKDGIWQARCSVCLEWCFITSGHLVNETTMCGVLGDLHICPGPNHRLSSKNGAAP